jgi:hypothetical protein
MGQGSGSTTLTDTISKGHSNSTDVGNTSYNKYATFDPAASGALKALSANNGSVNNDANFASQYYKNNLTQGSMNPYVQQQIDAQNKVADSQFGNRMSQVRSGGYGGGVGASSINQSKLASDFTNQQQSNNMNLLAQAFTQQQQQQQASASGLSNLTNNQSINAQNFLSLLKGEGGTSTTTNLNRTDNAKRAYGSSNTVSGGGGFGG